MAFACNTCVLQMHCACSTALRTALQVYVIDTATQPSSYLGL